MGERADDPSARRDEVRLICLAQNEERHLGLDDDAKGVRERAVEPESVHGRDRAESPLERVPVDPQEALPHFGREGSADLRPDRRRAATDVHRLHGEERGLARGGVTADREQQQREPEQDRLSRRRDPPDVGHAATRG